MTRSGANPFCRIDFNDLALGPLANCPSDLLLRHTSATATAAYAEFRDSELDSNRRFVSGQKELQSPLCLSIRGVFL